MFTNRLTFQTKSNIESNRKNNMLLVYYALKMI